MKRIFSLGLLLFTATLYAQSYNLTIHGNLKKLRPGAWVYCQWYDTEHMSLGPEHWDSVQNTAAGFTFRLQVEEGGGNELVLLIGRKGGMLLYADKGEIDITGDDSTLNHVEISGSPFARELNEFHHFINDQPALAGYESARARAMAARRGGDSVARQQTALRLQELDSVRKMLSLRWIDQHSGSPIAVFIMHDIYEPLYGKLAIDEQEAILNRLSAGAVKNKVAEAMRNSIRTERLTGIGRKAPDFTQGDTLGRPVSLKDFRGKYVLIDFWASWCGPCRRENPNVVRAFNKYKEKGFTVLGVSLDQPGKKEAWLKAIHEDGLVWTHVSDLKYWNNEVAKLYDVKAVPANFLLGPDGTILARDLRGEELDSKLAGLLISVTGEAQPGEISRGEQEHPFTFSGTIQGKDTGYLSLVATDQYDHRIRDTASIRNGRFEFKGMIPHPLIAFLSEGKSPKSANDANSVSFFLDPGETVARLQYGNFRDITLTGAKTQTELKGLEKQKAEAATAADREKIDLEYILAHPDSYAAVFLLRGRIAGLSGEDRDKYFNALSPALRLSGFGRYIRSVMDGSKLGAPGTKAIDFTSIDINGKTLRLADFKGKYVLLDFWASWCAPCRKGNPHLLEVYARYKDKGFEIIGVSDDDNKPDAWRKAVVQDGIGVWRHVLRGLDMKKVAAGDLNYGDHAREISSSRYGITALPTKILVDPEGNIIGRYSGGGDDEGELDRKLEGVLGR